MGKTKLPTRPDAAIRRAKLAIQAFHLNTDESKSETLRTDAIEAIENAKIHPDSNRKQWEYELLIESNKTFSNAVGSTNWYTLRPTIQWSLTEMPDWARSGEKDPPLLENILGLPYARPVSYHSR